MKKNIYVLCVSWLIILIVVTGCDRSELRKENTYCRTIVNTKDGNMSLVTFDSNGVGEEKHWSNIIHLKDNFIQIIPMHYIANKGKYKLMQLWGKDISNGTYVSMNGNDILYENSWSKKWSMLCLPLKFHIKSELQRFGKIIDPYKEVPNNIIETSPLSKSYFLRSELDENEYGRTLCYCDELWCKYEHKSNYSCELNAITQKYQMLEIYRQFIVSFLRIEMDMCADMDSNCMYHQDILSMNSDGNVVKDHFNSFLENEEVKRIKQGLNTKAFRPVLFTYGNKHRRWFGHLVRETSDGQYRRIELPFMTEGLEKILNEIENAPDGCGHFDWDTVELVNKSGQRYKIADGDYEAIAGIYWLKPDDRFSLDMLDDEPEHPIVIDEGYEAPNPQPNCRYFSDEGHRERWEAKRRLCYECERKYGSRNGTGIEPEETCAEYDRDYDEVKDIFEILYE